LIRRLYLRNLVTFEEIELDFSAGLAVFTGPSGAGKSVLLSAILSSFGHDTQSNARLCEVIFDKPSKLDSDIYELESELVIKALKKEKLRYFLNGQHISKKELKRIFSPYVQYLSVRSKGEFDSPTLISLLDKRLLREDKSFKRVIKEYQKRFKNYEIKSKELAKIRADESKIEERIEYAKYEIEKIEKINPKIGEDEKLLEAKKQLSRIDKLKDALSKAMSIFAAESAVEEVYRLLDKDASVFTEMMNQIRADFEETEHLTNELEEMDVENILDRLSDITDLKHRYGSIEEALEFKEKKKKELLGYQNITKDKSILENFLHMEYAELLILSKSISSKRKEAASLLATEMQSYLAALKLPQIDFMFEEKPLDIDGADNVEIRLGGSRALTLSGGEFNRLRLALMVCVIDERSQGVLIVDEIDANVSGDESIAIAQMIKRLSSVYQVFAISHQPHLSAQANQHLLVTKRKNKSRVVELNEKERVEEIARIIAGENPRQEAIEFAKKLRS